MDLSLVEHSVLEARTFVYYCECSSYEMIVRCTICHTHKRREIYLLTHNIPCHQTFVKEK
jgi:hypothetical protein